MVLWLFEPWSEAFEIEVLLHSRQRFYRWAIAFLGFALQCPASFEEYLEFLEEYWTLFELPTRENSSDKRLWVTSPEKMLL